jgi:hypothetical protein
VAEAVALHGTLVVGDEGELMVELEDPGAVEALSADLADRFGDQVLLAP